MRQAVILPLLSCLFPPLVEAWSCNDAGASAQLDLVSLASVDDKAVCNDGSSASYYFKDNDNPKLWVVYLAGGGWCYDLPSCTARFDGSDYPHHDCRNSSLSKPCFMSNKDFPKTCGKTGMFDAKPRHSPFYMANQVYVPYCSSDGWMGDGKFHDWEFRGARVARAVIKDLLEKGLSKGSTLVFGGGSAGGRGAMVLLDEIADSLPGVFVRGFLDSPFYIDIESYSPKFKGFQMQHIGVLNNFNASSVVSSKCKEKYAGAESWKCLFGQYRMPFVTTPSLMMASQLDAWQLSHLVHGYSGIESNPTFTAEELKFIQKFADMTHAQIKMLRNLVPASTSLYSAACYNHHISEKQGFWNSTTSAGRSEADASRKIRAGGLYDVDDCEGYNCGKGCGGKVSFPTAETLQTSLLV